MQSLSSDATATSHTPSSTSAAVLAHDEIWQRLCDFEFDVAGCVQTFSRRLAREQGWSHEFALRAVHEYRRFLFLTVRAGHPVCPSEEVDEVWHLHLVFTRSYWQKMCAEVLGRPLHHAPTEGGAAEMRKHWQMYRETLASYERLFGAQPPRDLWPLPLDRFDPTRQTVRVDTQQFWMLRKPRWWPTFGSLFGLCHFGYFRASQCTDEPSRRVVASHGLPGQKPWLTPKRRTGCDGFQQRFRPAKRVSVPMLAITPLIFAGLGPLDLRGTDFLSLYVTLLVVFVLGGLALRFTLWPKSSLEDDVELSPTEVGYLVGGKVNAVMTSLAGMIQEGAIETEIPKSRFLGVPDVGNTAFSLVKAPVTQNDDLTVAIVEQLQASSLSFAELSAQVKPATDAIGQRLVKLGLVHQASTALAARLTPMLVMWGLAAFGGIKIAIGISRDKPVAILVILSLFTFMASLCFLYMSRRSAAGDRLLASYQARFADLQGTVKDLSATPLQAAMCAAVFGYAAMNTSSLTPLHDVWRKMSASSTSGCSHSGCSGSGCGSGCGGGCGGCGGD